MKPLDTLAKLTEKRIEELRNDKLICRIKKASLIKENKSFLSKILDLQIEKAPESEPMEREQDNGYNHDRFDYLTSD